ncbi:MAG: peroxiredoxin [Bacteroidota bacterium]
MLNKGDSLPEFDAKDQDGQLVKSSTLVGNQSLVLYFYPKDETPGCTKEACSFRDHYHDFTEAGAQVVGISSDSVESHKKFADKHNLPFTLLSDESRRIEKKFGVKRNLFGLIPGRVTFIFAKDGKLAHKFDSQINIQGHIDEALSIIKQPV